MTHVPDAAGALSFQPATRENTRLERRPSAAGDPREDVRRGAPEPHCPGSLLQLQQAAPHPAPGPPLEALGLLSHPPHARHFKGNRFYRSWGATPELQGELRFQNSVSRLCKAATRPVNERMRVGAALALPLPLLGICSVSPLSQLYFQVPRNQLHCFTKETRLNVKKPDNKIVSRALELSCRSRNTRNPSTATTSAL